MKWLLVIMIAILSVAASAADTRPTLGEVSLKIDYRLNKSPVDQLFADVVSLKGDFESLKARINLTFSRYDPFQPDMRWSWRSRSWRDYYPDFGFQFSSGTTVYSFEYGGVGDGKTISFGAWGRF